MLLVHAFAIALTLSGDPSAQNDLVYVINHLPNQVEWITEDSTESISRNTAINRLQKLTTPPGVVFRIKHESEWRKGRSYKIIELSSAKANHRIFFHCKKKGDVVLVNRIKITKY